MKSEGCVHPIRPLQSPPKEARFALLDRYEPRPGHQFALDDTHDRIVGFPMRPPKRERVGDWMYGANRAMCLGTRAGAGDYEKRFESGEGPPKTGSQLEQLRELNPEELRQQWQILFDADPPPKLRSSLMAQGIAYRLQEKALGGLTPATMRLLERIADAAAARRQAAPPPAKIRVSGGTMLIREWHGTKHQVTVLKDGFLYRAKHFRSLSQIARAITGSRWSGPLFFGLKAARKEQINEAA